ncbi:MAG TPA: hypothetical protein VHV54_24105 [Candidatus Binatia bacterium]|nr:hypothetical protein [Candidatus Binatia bacterium]
MKTILLVGLGTLLFCAPIQAADKLRIGFPDLAAQSFRYRWAKKGDSSKKKDSRQSSFALGPLFRQRH